MGVIITLTVMASMSLDDLIIFVGEMISFKFTTTTYSNSGVLFSINILSRINLKH